jgi:hypothetical protein
MSLAAALLLAAATAHAPPADKTHEPDRGAQVERARVSVTITRAAVLQHGALVRGHDDRAPRSQRQSSDGRVTYEFE